MIFERKGFTPVECDAPLPCPFCGADAAFHCLKDDIVWSSATLVADRFWFDCSKCHAGAGCHGKTAQQAAEQWNRRPVREEA